MVHGVLSGEWGCRFLSPTCDEVLGQNRTAKRTTQVCGSQNITGATTGPEMWVLKTCLLYILFYVYLISMKLSLANFQNSSQTQLWGRRDRSNVAGVAAEKRHFCYHILGFTILFFWPTCEVYTDGLFLNL